MLLKGSTAIAGRSGNGKAEGDRSKLFSATRSAGRLLFDGACTVPTKRRPAAIADGRSGGVDAAGKCRIGNGSAAPDQADQIPLTDDPVAVLHQIDQQVEDLRLHRDWRPVAKQLAPLGIKRLIVKGKLHAASPDRVRSQGIIRPVSRINQAPGKAFKSPFRHPGQSIITIPIIACGDNHDRISSH
jgi:hypothetical protein